MGKPTPFRMQLESGDIIEIVPDGNEVAINVTQASEPDESEEADGLLVRHRGKEEFIAINWTVAEIRRFGENLKRIAEESGGSFTEN